MYSNTRKDKLEITLQKFTKAVSIIKKCNK